MIRMCSLLLACLLAVVAPFSGRAADYVETPSLEAKVAAGELPPVADRLPATPLVVDLEAEGKSIGKPGGEIGWLAGRARDIRIQNVYSYARLVGWKPDFTLAADILESFESDGDRVFTFHLRDGHKWSDGQPFTSEDFRYQWEKVENNPEIKPYGPDSRLIVDGEAPTVTYPDEQTVVYAWSKPNPAFLPALAAPNPLYLYAPAHYLRQFHAEFADPATLEAAVAESGERNWAALHIRRGDLYEATNPELPSLEPWVNITPAPAERFIFERNPYFHRVDSAGHQLPYLDRVTVTVVDGSLIAAKAGAGESDLQARGLRFDKIGFLKEGEQRGSYHVLLWPQSRGSEVALFPNLNANDPVWRQLNRDVRFRRALSLAIDRDEINQVSYFGLARPSANTVLPESPYWNEEYANAWIAFDVAQANALLDEIGLTERNGEGVRLLPDGRPLEIIVETAGERSEEVDVLQLVAETWAQIGVKLFINTSQRDVFYNRVFAGDAVMAVWSGVDNGLLNALTPPVELAPVNQAYLQYPKWGQYLQTGGTAGEAPDMDAGIRLMELHSAWMATTDAAERERIVGEMLQIQSDQVLSIGTVQGVVQPIVVRNALRNIPEVGVFSWDPGAHFGMYRIDAFWLDK